MDTQDFFTGTKFERPNKKRAKHRKLVHVVDAGEDQIRSDQIRSDQIRSDQIRSDIDKLFF